METREILQTRVRDLEQRLAEAEDTLRALRDGEVDAVVAGRPGGQHVYTLKGADEPYRVLVQEMAQGAITVTEDGLILFSNQQFADTIASPLERVIGCRVFEFLDAGYRPAARALLDQAQTNNAKGEIRFRKSDGRVIPAFVSINRLKLEGLNGFCMVVTDLTEQKRNEGIVVSERLSRSILEQAAEAILVIDVEGKIIRASRTADRLARTPVILRDLDDVFQLRSPGGVPLHFQAILSLARKGAASEPLEVIARTFQGDEMDVLFSAAALSGANDDLIGCIVHLTDISQRKRVERKLRESEAMYRTLADAMPQIVYIHGPDGSCEFVNRKWSEFIGDDAGVETRNTAWASLVHRDDLARETQAWSEARQKNRPFEMEYRLLGSDGQYHWHLSRAVPVRDESGQVSKWIGTSTNIDQWKLTESKLRESETRLRTMAEAVPEILFTTHPDGYCDYVSARAYEFTGLPVGALEGFGWLSPIHPDDREGVRECWTRSARTGTDFDVEYRMGRADGTYRWMRVRAVPTAGSNGEVIKWFGICADIDNHKRLEESLQERSKELMRSNEELQQFAYVVSHDLQEPLRTIGTMTKLLSMKYESVLDADSQELARYIDIGVRRMSNLIRDLLDYSRVSSELPSPSKPVDCNALLTVAVMNVQAQISDTGAEVTHDPLPTVLADEQVVRLFQNLLGNSLKYRSEMAPRIHVSAERQRDQFVISIRDNGIGFEMKYAQRIFDVFHRLHRGSEYDGTGIGLAICRKIVERHGGRIWAESVLGAGSTFHFSLPAA